MNSRHRIRSAMRTTRSRAFVASLASAARQAFALGLFAAEPTKAQLEFFENRIRPIFAENCYKCHSPAKGKIKGGLELDWKGGWEKGGDPARPSFPGDPEKSLLIKAVRYTDPDLQMPPKGEKLSDAQIDDLVAWVKMGAPDPRTTRPALTPHPANTAAGARIIGRSSR